MFDRFVKLDTFSQGLGLGLTVCRLIASALGGTIKLDTNYSGGARFALSIPLR
ncbi:MAG: ATP-binding protein [Alistipes finegoldii]